MSQLRVATLRVDSIEDLTRVLDGADSRSVPLSSGVAKGAILHASAGDVLVSAGQWSADIRTRGSIRSQRISLGVKLDSESTHFSFRSGREVLAGDVYTLAQGDDVDYRVMGPISYAFVTLSADHLLAHVGEDARRESVAFWERRRWFCAPPAVRDSTARALQRMVTQLSRHDGTVSGPALRQLQCDLLEPFLAGMMADEPKWNERNAMSSATIVRKVEDWVDGQSPATIQISDLSGALHLSRRTLQRAFTETLGMGPARYLTLKRLTAVRTELRRGDPATTSVTRTATQYGFWELGRFAQDYRRTFGERPSETLSKSLRQADHTTQA